MRNDLTGTVNTLLHLELEYDSLQDQHHRRLLARAIARISRGVLPLYAPWRLRERSDLSRLAARFGRIVEADRLIDE